jgi:DNA (cytosine-5)-methyltransferase 1
MTYYNDNNGFACAWLRELMAEGLIPKGDVDDHSICDVTPGDVSGYDQCHFFAGIGGWAYALELAGYPRLKCWSASLPCPSFSTAGSGSGFADPRHLWPQFFRLVRSLHPPVLLGEQVEAAVGYGWLDLVSADLESEGYAVWAAVLPACGVGAPHRRNRLFWGARLMDDAECEGLEGLGEPLGREQEDGGGETVVRVGPSNTGFWDDAVWLPCHDGKCRPVPPQSSLFPLADGIPNRMGILRGAGNAIVPQVGAVFIRAFLDSVDDCN